MNEIIRHANMDDFEEINQLLQQWKFGWEIDREGLKKTIKNYITGTNRILFVAESNKKIVGYIYGTINPVFYLNGDVAIIEEININSSFTKKGLGRKLMSSFEDEAKQSGVVMLQVYTKSKLPFYEKLEFVKTGTYLIKQIDKF